MALRETEKQWRRHEDIKRIAAELAVVLRPRIEAQQRETAIRRAREIEEDQFGYDWWRWQKDEIVSVQIGTGASI